MSKLSKALNIQSTIELVEWTKRWDEDTVLCLKRVLFDELSYEEAGKPYDKSKHSVYEALKRLYYKKFGRAYGREQKNTNKPPII